MKRLGYTLIYLFCTANLLSQTNAYYPLPDTNSLWCQTWTYNHFSAYSDCNEIYFFSGDTIFNGISYKKLYRKNGGIGCYTSTFRHGGIRQDTVSKKVYYCDPSTSTPDTLLYYFNLHVGDTLPRTYNNYDPDAYVYSIDSTLVGTTYRKKYNIALSPSTNIYVSLIEGIGSTSGLLYPLRAGAFQTFTLNCFSYAGTVTYTSNPNTSHEGYCCAQLYTVDINSFTNYKDAITTYPNPAYDVFFIEADKGVKLSIDLYDVNGRHVFTEIVNGISKIDVATLDNGIYTLTIKCFDHVMNKKLVILR